MNAINEHIDYPKLTLQRRKVYTALKPLLSIKKLLPIMWLWEEEISKQHPMQMRKFIALLVEKGYLGENAQKAYKNLVYTFMQNNEAKLDEDPYTAMLEFKNELLVESSIARDQRDKSKFKSPDNIVFEKVLSEFLASLKILNRKSIENIAKNLYTRNANLKVTKAQKRDLASWVINHTESLELEYKPNQMSAIINATYITACDCVGPVKADKCLSLAIKKTEDLPEALEFSPRQLL